MRRPRRKEPERIPILEEATEEQLDEQYVKALEELYSTSSSTIKNMCYDIIHSIKHEKRMREKCY